MVLALVPGHFARRELAYAYLQIPIKPDAAGNFQLDFALLNVSKTALIGAMYSTLGVEDQKNCKPS